MESKGKVQKTKASEEKGSAVSAMSAALDSMGKAKKANSGKAAVKKPQATSKLEESKSSKTKVAKESVAIKTHIATKKIVFPKELFELDIIVKNQGKTTDFMTFPSMATCVIGLSKISHKHIMQSAVLECALGLRKAHCGFTFEFADENVKYDKLLNPYLSHKYILVRLDDGFVAYVNDRGSKTCTMDIYTISDVLRVMPKQIYRAAMAIEDNDITKRVIFMQDNVRYFVAFADEVDGSRKGLYKWCKIQEAEQRLFPCIGGVVYTSLEEACGVINSVLQDEGYDESFSMDALNSLCYNAISKSGLRFTYVTARETLGFITKSTSEDIVAEKEKAGAVVARAFMQNKKYVVDCFADVFSNGSED